MCLGLYFKKSKVVSIAQIYNVKCLYHIRILYFTLPLLHADIFCTTGKLRSGSKIMQEAIPVSVSNDWLSGYSPQYNSPQLSAADNAVYNKSSLSKCKYIVVILSTYASVKGCYCINYKQGLIPGTLVVCLIQNTVYLLLIY